MARVFMEGFELGNGAYICGKDATDDSNFDATVVTSPVRSGTYAMQLDSEFGYCILDIPDGQEMYVQIYFQPDTGDWSRILALGDVDGFGKENAINEQYLTLNGSNQIELRDDDGSLLATGGTAVASGEWTRIALHINRTGISGHSVEVRINGATDISWSGTLNYSGDITHLFLYQYADDVVVNDTSGSAQNSWPGEDKIVLLLPSADSTPLELDANPSGSHSAILAGLPADDTDSVETDDSSTPDGQSSRDAYTIASVPADFGSASAIQPIVTVDMSDWSFTGTVTMQLDDGTLTDSGVVSSSTLNEPTLFRGTIYSAAPSGGALNAAALNGMTLSIEVTNSGS